MVVSLKLVANMRMRVFTVEEATWSPEGSHHFSLSLNLALEGLGAPAVLWGPWIQVVRWCSECPVWGVPSLTGTGELCGVGPPTWFPAFLISRT